MERDDDQQLWDLLGKTAAPQVSPFFSRNVLRKVRELQSRPSGLSRWFSFRRLVPAASAVAAVVAAFLLVHGPGAKHTPRAAKSRVVAKAESDDDLAADIDDLVGSDDEDDTAVL